MICLRSHASIRFEERESRLEEKPKTLLVRQLIEAISAFLEEHEERSFQHQYADLVPGYFADMYDALVEQFRVLRRGGYAVCVVGNSMFAGPALKEIRKNGTTVRHPKWQLPIASRAGVGCNRNVMSEVQASRPTMCAAVAADASPILVVDDDAKIVQLVRTYLEREGFEVITAADGPAALAAFRDRRPRLVVLDLMLPAIDGLAITRIVRAESDVPILMLSARGATADRVLGIDEGADDYVAKPFSPAELMSRVKAILRRVERSRDRAAQGPVQFRDLIIDASRHDVRRGDEKLDLTHGELRLLLTLVEAEGRILTRESLLDSLYGEGEGDVMERTVDVYVRRLREKLGDDADHPRYIATVRGAGYRTVDDR